jgi:hypothetical protein
MKAILKKGWRCFKVSRHPHGYRFRRASKDTPVETVPGAVEFADQRRIRLPDGSVAVAFADALTIAVKTDNE